MEEELNLHPVSEDIIAGIGISAIREMEAFLRQVYQQGATAIEGEAQLMLARGVDQASVARWVVDARNRLKVEIRRLDLEIIRRWAEMRNRIHYRGAANPSVGPDYEYLQRRGRTNAQIIQRGAVTNTGVNRATGRPLLPTEGTVRLPSDSTSGTTAARVAIELTESQRVWMGRLRLCGRIMIYIDIGMGAYRFYRAPTVERPRVLFEEVGSIGGALAGGWAVGAAGAEACGTAGAAVGVWFGGVGAGPGAVVGVAVCGIGGAIGGAWLGRNAGRLLADQLYPVQDTALVESTSL